YFWSSLFANNVFIPAGPASVTLQPGQRLTISCQVSYSTGSYYTAWIRQPAGKGLEWIGMKHGTGASDYKDSLKNKFSIDAQSSSKTVTLNGQNMQPEDSAVYYCARYDHSDTNTLHGSTKASNVNKLCQITRGGALRPFLFIYLFFIKTLYFVCT
uniref:Ig-like domain-containing protein n=1 Tax=Poecilia latipinna TaxID=48699 RepID=A0A3B3TQW2_9TELE